MKKSIPIILTLLLLITLWFCSGTSQPLTPKPLQFNHADKLIHFLVFGLVATAFYRIPQIRSMGALGMLIAIILTSAYGAIDELHQASTPGRSMDILDWLADTAGAITAMLVYAKIHFYQKFLEFNIAKSIPHRHDS